MRQHYFRRIIQLRIERHGWITVIAVLILFLASDSSSADSLKSFEKDYFLQSMRIQEIRNNRAKWNKRDSHEWHGKEVPAVNMHRSYMFHRGLKKGLTPTSEQSKFYRNRYDSIVFRAAGEFDLPPSLIQAVIRAESGFDRYALSHKGAQGLMQLMPQTAKDLGVSDPYDPWQNIFGGTRLLRNHLHEFRSLKKALIAYNAGPEVVRKKRRIPTETKKYIVNVIRYYHRYQNEKF